MASLPYNLIPEQLPMFKALANIVIRETIPGRRPSQNPSTFIPVRETIPAPSEKLVSAYLAWCGADSSKYATELPAHLFTQFGMPLLSKQMGDTRYRLSSVINQGCDITVNHPLSRHQSIDLEMVIKDITEDNGRARVHQQLSISQGGRKDDVIVDCYLAFIIGSGVLSS